MSMWHRSLWAVVVGVAALAGSVKAEDVVVSPGDLNGWVLQQSGTASTAFVNGPAIPLCGTGSVQLAVGADGDSAAQARTAAYNGALLADIDELSYATFVQQDGSGGQAPYIILNVDL